MYYSAVCPSPLGMLTLGSDGEHLIGLWLEGQKYFGGAVREALEERDGLPVFDAARDWLARYFAGEKPMPSELPLCPIGGEFRQRVWRLHVQPGRGRRGGPQPHLHHHSLPPGRGLRRQPHRVCRRHRRQAPAAGARGRGALPPVRPQEGHGALSHGSLTLSADADRPQPPISSPGLGGLPGCRRTGAGIEQTSRS